MGWILDQVLKLVAREAPDGLLALSAYLTSQLGETFCLKHRVASGEGDIGEGVIHDFLHQVLRRGHRAMVDVPRLGIVALRAVIRTTGTIDGCAESRTIHHCVMYYA